MFFVRQNKATSRSIVLDTLPLAYVKTPLTSKQDADVLPTISIQCFTSALYSETRFDHVRGSPKRGYFSPLCLRRDPLYATPFPLAYDETSLTSEQDKPKIGPEKKV